LSICKCQRKKSEVREVKDGKNYIGKEEERWVSNRREEDRRRRKWERRGWRKRKEQEMRRERDEGE
tara:strand:- start:3 stop:200 length:198 start_codon:yes stop_codon:yes gene_type:complete